LIVVAALAGKTNLSTTLSLSRAVAFLPLFAAGVWARQHSWLITDRRWHRRDVVWIAGALLLAPILVTFLSGNSAQLVHLSTPYGIQGVGPKVGALFRIGLFVVAFAAVRASFLLSPRRQTFLTLVGVNSLSVYLLHFYLLEPLRNELSLAFWERHLAWIAIVVTVGMCAIARLRPARAWEWLRARLDSLLFGREKSSSTGTARSAEGMAQPMRSP
jgi:fucose 4-O-acetylase-like acetyltransferase